MVKTTNKLGETCNIMGVAMERRGRQRTGREGNHLDRVEKEQCNNVVWGQRDCTAGSSRLRWSVINWPTIELKCDILEEN